MARVTSKLDKSEARGGFEITSAITSWIVQLREGKGKERGEALGTWLAFHLCGIVWLLVEWILQNGETLRDT